LHSAHADGARFGYDSETRRQGFPHLARRKGGHPLIHAITVLSGIEQSVDKGVCVCGRPRASAHYHGKRFEETFGLLRIVTFPLITLNEGGDPNNCSCTAARPLDDAAAAPAGGLRAHSR
ncbi:hypothetical protein EVAR_4134_1, partial [Eumeta japonica]